MHRENNQLNSQLSEGEISQSHVGDQRIATKSDILNELVIGLRSVIDQAGSYIFIKDILGRYTYVNQKVQDLFADTFENIIGKDDSYFFDLEFTNELRINDRRVLDFGEIIEREENNIIKSTSEKRIYWTVKKPLHDDAGRIIGLSGISTDITERKAIENALRTSESHLRLSQAVGGIGTWEIDFINGQQTWSSNCANLLGVPAQNMRTWEDLLDIVIAEDRERLRAAMQVHIETKTRYDLEYRVSSAKGDIRWIRSVGEAERDPAGQPIVFRGILQDMTEQKSSQTELELSFSLLQAALESTHDAILVVDLNNKWVLHNKRFLDLWNMPEDLVVAKDDSAALSYALEQLIDADAFFAKVKDLYSTPEASSFDTLKFKDGKIIERYSFPQKISDKIVGRVWSFRDVTERKKAEEELHLAASVFTSAREAIMITRPDGTIINVNDSFRRITGYHRDELLGVTPHILNAGLQGAEFYELFWENLQKKGYWQGEIWNRRKNGEVYAVMATVSAVRDLHHVTQHYVALFSDITVLKEHQQQLEHIAHYDALTNLPNRVLLADRLKQAMMQADRHKRPLAVAYLDLDGFKTVNDTYGHTLGDELLIIVSKRMKEVLREGDTLARIGGDEFIAVLVDLEQVVDCEPVLKRLLHAASYPVTIANTKLVVSTSIGVTLYPQDNVDADQLIRHADQAMYIAKQAGKNCYYLFDIVHDSSIKTQRELLERIRNAFEQSEFILHYQPKVNMLTGQVLGVEALIRWQHPEHGLLLPADILPIIENHEISLEIGKWVIDTALSQLGEWNAAGLNMSVSVNIGALQLLQQNFAAQLSTLLVKHPNVNPCDLELEILETSALENLADVSAIMHTCCKMGVSFALDDFGTGYSSLTYLRRLPVEMLKIDQTFVRDMLDDPDDLTIVNSVIGLASAFKRQVIAEGVETAAHGKMLQSIGCELAQGYGIARPMSALDIPSWVTKWEQTAHDWNSLVN